MKHALRGAVTAWLALIALQAIGASGSGRVAGLLSDVDALVKRALDPTVAAIPDRRTAASYTAAAGAGSGADPTVTNPNTPYKRPTAAPAPSPYPTRMGGAGGTAYAI